MHPFGKPPSPTPITLCRHLRPCIMRVFDSWQAVAYAARLGVATLLVNDKWHSVKWRNAKSPPHNGRMA